MNVGVGLPGGRTVTAIGAVQRLSTGDLCSGSSTGSSGQGAGLGHFTGYVPNPSGGGRDLRIPVLLSSISSHLAIENTVARMS